MKMERLSGEAQVLLRCGDFDGTQVLQSSGELADARRLLRDGGVAVPTISARGNTPPAEASP